MRRLLLLLVAALLLLPAAANGTSSTGLLISQVYGGGGNTGASYANDFVELLNAGSSAINVDGWSVQYASASSTSWSATALTGTVQPGHYYLVGLASSGSVGASLPAADASGTTNLSVTGGKLALVHDTNALTCGATAGSCSSVSTVADLVGYGGASDYEGTDAAAAGSATLSVVRAGCVDSDRNDLDFATLPPSPRNSATAPATCGSGGGGSSSVSKEVAVDVDVQTVLSLTLQHAALSFGPASAGQTPVALGDQLTVVSNNATGYALSVHRSTFTPADLPLGIGTSAPSGGTLGAGVSGSTMATVPIAPAADLLLGTTSAHSAPAGDVWPASVGFASALPVVPAGHYTATVTFTVIAR